MLRISNHFISSAIVLLIVLDFCVLIGCAYSGLSWQMNMSGPFAMQVENLFVFAVIFSMVMVFSMSALGMYQVGHHSGLRTLVLRLMPSCILGFLLVRLIVYLLPEPRLDHGILAVLFLIAGPAVLAIRLLYFRSAKTAFLKTHILFLGSGTLARECAMVAQESGMGRKFHIVGHVPSASEERCVSEAGLLPAGGTLLDIAKKHEANEIVVALQNRRSGALPIDELLTCKLHGVKVTDAAAFFEREACQIRVDSLHPSWLVFGGGFDQGRFRVISKKIFDVVVSLCVLVVSLPILLLTALCIYLEDRGPIFYRQERVGKDGKTFMVLKFRSMRTDAERMGQPQWATVNDPRTTRTGRIIRLLRIDEFPQILNVLKGDMSFVGPRPERPFFVDELAREIPYYHVRHSIKPGITGMAQVRYQYGASVEDAVQKLQYDLYYVKNNSLFLDLLILIDTLQVVLLGKGSR
jgi:sugar transferase (PEP-CTERM system associated)